MLTAGLNPSGEGCAPQEASTLRGPAAAEAGQSALLLQLLAPSHTTSVCGVTRVGSSSGVTNGRCGTGVGPDGLVRASPTTYRWPASRGTSSKPPIDAPRFALAVALQTRDEHAFTATGVSPLLLTARTVPSKIDVTPSFVILSGPNPTHSALANVTDVEHAAMTITRALRERWLVLSERHSTCCVGSSRRQISRPDCGRNRKRGNRLYGTVGVACGRFGSLSGNVGDWSVR